MLRRLITLLVLIPVGIVIVTLAVANRQPVSISLPLDIGGEPIVLLTAPLFVLLFIALIAGMFLGSFATWLKQGKHRKAARTHKLEATKMGFEAQKQKARAETVSRETQEGRPTLALASDS